MFPIIVMMHCINTDLDPQANYVIFGRLVSSGYFNINENKLRCSNRFALRLLKLIHIR